MNEAVAIDIASSLKQVVRHLANIDANLRLLVGDGGLKMELGIHEKLDQISKKK